MIRVGKKIENCTLIRRDKSLENHCEVLSEDYKITRPTIICMGGNCTLSTRKANNTCKIAERLIGLKDPKLKHEYATSMNVDIIGVAYGKTYDKYNREQNTSSLSYKDVINLSHQLLEPLVIKDGKPIDIILLQRT